MKTKQSVLFVIASLGTTVTFAQVRLNVVNHTQAAVNKSVNVSAVNGATARAATVTKSTVHTSVNKTVQAGAAIKDDVKKATNVPARVNAQASVHASDEAKTNANENAAIFGTKADGTVQAGTDANVEVNGKPIIEKTEQKANNVTTKAKEAKESTETKAKASTNSTIKKIKQTKVNGTAEGQTEVKMDNNINGSVQ